MIRVGKNIGLSLLISHLRVAALCAIGIFSFVAKAHAGVEQFCSPANMGTLGTGGLTVTVTDDKFATALGILPVGTPGSISDWVSYDKIRYQKPWNSVMLSVDPSVGSIIPDSFICEVAFLVTYQDSLDSTHQRIDTLKVSYNRLENRKHKDMAVLRFVGGYQLTAEVLAVTYQNTTLTPDIFVLKCCIDVDRYYDFDPTVTTSPGVDTSLLPTENRFKISWSGIDGASEYDLEWTYVNDLKLDTAGGPRIAYVPANGLKYDFHFNSTRVTVSGTCYYLTNIFEHGYVLYRIRGVGRWWPQTQDRKEGAWSWPDTGSVSGFTSPVIIHKGHEDSLNWQYVATYAEEGKKKEVVSYFDGTLRNRQMVTKLNTDSTTIAAETIYDYQGRGAIQVLPAPTIHKMIEYYANFNRNALGNEYNANDFDTSRCSGRIPDSMKTNSGSSNYYSSLNPVKTAYQAFVPDAGGYPFSQVEYTPDNTGRVRRQSGVGKDMYLGSGKETKYYYGTPTQIELDRLFGDEAGFSSHYKKNMVIDPNGQVSVSYLDLRGHVIATALAGTAPANLSAIPSNTGATTLTEDMLNNNAVKLNDNAIVSNTAILVTIPATHNFSYALNPGALQLPDCSSTNVCYDGVYSVNFRIADECGNYILDTVFHNVHSHCSGSPFSYTFSKFLDIGSYTVTKELIVDENALNNYVDSFVNTHSYCLKTYNSFLTTELSPGHIDTSVCGCLSCGATIPAAPTLCDNAWHEMLADVSPGGLIPPSSAVQSSYIARHWLPPSLPAWY